MGWRKNTTGRNMSKTELYEAISARKGNGVRIRQELCFYDPEDVYIGLTSNSSIIKWLKFISNHYLPPSDKKVLLIYPCSTEKPYHTARSYKSLFKTLNNLRDKRQRVHVVTLSEPFGLVPEEFYGVKNSWHDWKNEWYDCPGLFEWWCKKYKLHYDKDKVTICIDILSDYIAEFLKRIDTLKIYDEKIALIRTYSSNFLTKNDHTHRRIIELSMQKANSNIILLPDLNTIKNLVNQRGEFAWDMLGVGHPIIQEMLYHKLNNLL